MSDLHGDPGNCQPAGTIPGAPANRKPDAHWAAAAAVCAAGRGAQANPAHAALDATAARLKAASGRAATTVATFKDT
jgi:hypothetical protein